MGEINRATIIAKLQELNPRTGGDRIRIYADAMIVYLEARENITRNGAITAHPRTGSPMENPYLKVQKTATDTMAKFRMNVGTLWEEVEMAE